MSSSSEDEDSYQEPVDLHRLKMLQIQNNLATALQGDWCMRKTLTRVMKALIPSGRFEELGDYHNIEDFLKDCDGVEYSPDRRKYRIKRDQDFRIPMLREAHHTRVPLKIIRQKSGHKEDDNMMARRKTAKSKVRALQDRSGRGPQISRMPTAPLHKSRSAPQTAHLTRSATHYPPNVRPIPITSHTHPAYGHSQYYSPVAQAGQQMYPQRTGIEIFYAAFGGRDVTSTIRQLYRGGQDTFAADPTLWGNPDPEGCRSLIVVYRDKYGELCNKVAYEKKAHVYMDGKSLQTTLTIPV